MRVLALSLLLVAQIACVAWRWWPGEVRCSGPVTPESLAVAPRQTDGAERGDSRLGVLLDFEADWAAGAVDPFDFGKRPGPGPVRKRSAPTKRTGKSLAAEALEDPTIVSAEWTRKRFALRKEYARFFIDEGVPPDRSARALDLLADLETGSSHAALAAREQRDPPQAAAVQKMVTQDLSAELNTLPGAELEGKLARYRTTLPVRRDVDLLASELRGLGEELPPPARAALVEIMATSQMRGTGFAQSGYDRERTLREAASVLTAAQLEGLNDLLGRRSPPKGVIIPGG